VRDPEGSHYENSDETRLNSLSSGRKKMKLLQLALEKQNYILAAHILVYGLIKAKVDRYPRNPQNSRRPHGCHGNKSNKRQKKE